MKKIGILGSTGSIGTQTIDVVKKNNDKFKVVLISGHKNIQLLYKQSQELDIPYVVITDKESFNKAKKMNFSAKLYYGIDEMLKLITPKVIDIVLNALVGNIGLKPTYTAVNNKVQLALANKESLVTGGQIIMELANKNNQRILPVDSEHSAIFQCLQGNDINQVDKIILTASGGPFRAFDRIAIQNKKAVEALKHPNWVMGEKISIDSATLVNKGLEVIEAKWLFNLKVDQIEVIVHPQSIIHSMVQFKDTSIIAQLGNPDMRLPIHYALNYPNRELIQLKKYDFIKNSSLTFEKPKFDIFPGLKLAYNAIKIGGTMPTVYNTINEIMVKKYLENKIGFYDITDMIEEEMSKHGNILDPSIEDIIQLDYELRERLK